MARDFYMVTMLVRDYVLLTLFLKLHNLARLLCHFGTLCSCPSRIWQWNKKNEGNKT